MPKPLEPRDDFDVIRRLISAEEEEALAHFRRGDFETKLRARLAAAGDARGPRFPWRPLAVPAAATALILVLAVAAFLLFRRPGGEARGETVNFTAAVRMLPGLTEVEGPGEAPSRAEATASFSGGPVGDVLARAYAQKKEVEDQSELPAAGLSAPRLSLKRKMEILFKDQVLERVLVSIHEKSKEV